MPLISPNMVCAVWLRSPIASIADSIFTSFHDVFPLPSDRVQRLGFVPLKHLANQVIFWTWQGIRCNNNRRIEAVIERDALRIESLDSPVENSLLTQKACQEKNEPLLTFLLNSYACFFLISKMFQLPCYLLENAYIKSIDSKGGYCYADESHSIPTRPVAAVVYRTVRHGNTMRACLGSSRPAFVGRNAEKQAAANSEPVPARCFNARHVIPKHQ